MPVDSTRDVLTSAIQQLSVPFKTEHDVRTVSMKLDAIAARLLRSDQVVKKVGEKRISQLRGSDTDLPSVLREVGGGVFAKVADNAENLLAVSRSSLVDLGETEGEVLGANALRTQLKDGLASVLAALDG